MAMSMPKLRVRGPARIAIWIAVGAVLLVAGQSAYLGWRGAQAANAEIRVLRDLRTILSSEVAYASINGGFFDQPRCLANPSGCVKGYPADRGGFLDSRRAAFGLRDGYEWTFHPGRPAPSHLVGAGRVSPTSVSSFAVVATPRERIVGVRAFCQDFMGQRCYVLAGSQILTPVNGRCPADCIVMG